MFQQTGRLRALGTSWPPRALCQLVGAPHSFSRTAEPASGGRWGALFWTGQHFSPCFLDPHHPEDQMAPFVSKESSYRISTFDIKIYTAYGVASYNGPFIPGLLSVYYLVSHRQNDLSAWPAAAPHCNCLCVLAWKSPRRGRAFSWSPVPSPSSPSSWTAQRASPLHKICCWLLCLQYKPTSFPSHPSKPVPALPPAVWLPHSGPCPSSLGAFATLCLCSFNGHCLKNLAKAEKTGLSGRENIVYKMLFSRLDSAHRSPTPCVLSDLILFLPPIRPSI